MKLLRITAHMIRFIDNLKHAVYGETLTKGYITHQEVEKAERLWIKSVQKSCHNKSKQLNNTLGLRVNEYGIILCKGRL